MHQVTNSPNTLVDIYPPIGIERDEVEFARWLQELGKRLIIAGLDKVSIIPMLTKNDALMVGIEAPVEQALRIKQIAYS